MNQLTQPEKVPTSRRVVDAIHELRNALEARYGEQFAYAIYGNNYKLASHTSKAIVEAAVEEPERPLGR